MDRFDGVSLKTRLYLLVLAAFVPVAVLIVYVAGEQRAIEMDAVLRQATLLAQSAAASETLAMEAARGLTAALGGAFLLVDGRRPDRLQGYLSERPHRTGAYAAFGILDPGGRTIAASPPSAATGEYGNRAWVAACLQQRRLTIGPYRGEHIDGRPVIFLAEPVIDPRGEPVAVAFAALDLSLVTRGLTRPLTELPSDSRLTVLEGERVLLRYAVDGGRWLAAQPLDPSLLRRIRDRPSGVLVAADENGASRIYAHAHMESVFRPGRVAVVLDIPRAVALAASRRVFARNVALLAASALLAVVFIWRAADVFFLRRVGAMVGASRRLAAGDLRARIGRIGARDELSHLAGVFDEMAASLQVRVEREEQANASLERSREQLRRLTAYQNDVREQERIRIAREIHDRLGQALTVLKMDLAWLRKHTPPGDRSLDDRLEAMLRCVGEAMETLHAVTAELRPVILDDFGLAAALEWQADAFHQHSGIGCRFENNGFEPDLPPDRATALFRIVQELLTNVARHARADEVTVRLDRTEDGLRLRVADNGRGITAEEIDSPHAFGLLGIRERLKPLDGRVTFEGRAREGTRVTIHLPLTGKGDAP